VALALQMYTAVQCDSPLAGGESWSASKLYAAPPHARITWREAAG